MPQLSEGLQSGILSSNILLAETPAATEYSGVTPTIWMSANVAAVVEVQHRNATNSANIWAHRFYITAAQPVSPPLPSGQIILEEGERLRVVLITGLVGAVQASILT